MSPEQRRIFEQAAPTDLTRLWRSLLPLKTVVTVLQTGAHPDDETSRLLAALRSQGLRMAYACATRGQGGQNAIGPEAGADLGLLRTAEMEAAARILDIDLYWLGIEEDDPITDFGFSKSAEDTLARWGAEHLLERLVRVIRTVRPDILLPSFLDVGGQHGHHRAVTRMTEAAFHAAADPAAFPEHRRLGLEPWSTAKYYLPAFGGGGGSYDDEQPPPPATLVIDTGAVDPIFGATPAQMGEWSRVYHLSQGMGRGLEAAPSQVKLHLKASRVGPVGAEASILDGLPHTLADLSDDQGAGALGGQAALNEALASFLDRAALEPLLARAQAALAEATAPPAHAHRIARTKALVERAIGETRRNCSDAPVARSEPVSLDPAISVTATPARLPLRIGRGDAMAINVTLENCGANPFDAQVGLEAPENWRAAPPEAVRLAAGETYAALELRVVPPADSTSAPIACPILVNGEPATTFTTIAYEHIRPIHVARPAIVHIRAMDVALPEQTRIACVDGGSDQAVADFARLGIAVDPLSDAALQAGDVEAYDTILVGIFALRTRPALQAALPRLKAWIEAGGNLVTLYHRPADAWDPERTPPAPIDIGQPSLRFRVTDPAAPVTHLVPDHPLLNVPNRIGPEDWAGWVKERGLYFARVWSDAYQPLLSLADPGEAPHRGALLAGRFGRGQHVHVSLALHTQLAHLVPGGYRVMANLLAKANR